jgi:hypothetical protein
MFQTRQKGRVRRYKQKPKIEKIEIEDLYKEEPVLERAVTEKNRRKLTFNLENLEDEQFEEKTQSKFSTTRRKQSSRMSYLNNTISAIYTEEESKSSRNSKKREYSPNLRNLEKMPENPVISRYSAYFHNVPRFTSNMQKKLFSKYFKDQFIIDFEKDLKGEMENLASKERDDSKFVVEEWTKEYREHKKKVQEDSKKSKMLIHEHQEKLKKVKRIKEISDFQFDLSTINRKKKLIKNEKVDLPEEFENDPNMAEWAKRGHRTSYARYIEEHPEFVLKRQMEAERHKSKEERLELIRDVRLSIFREFTKGMFKYADEEDPELLKSKWKWMRTQLRKNIRQRIEIGIELYDEKEDEIFPPTYHSMKNSKKAFLLTKTGCLDKLKELVEESPNLVFQYDTVS